DVAGVDDARRATLARRRRRDAGGAEIAVGIDEAVVGDGNRRALAAAGRVDGGRQRAVGGDGPGIDAVAHGDVAGALRLAGRRVTAPRARATVVDHGDVAAGRVDGIGMAAVAVGGRIDEAAVADVGGRGALRLDARRPVHAVGVDRARVGDGDVHAGGEDAVGQAAVRIGVDRAAVVDRHVAGHAVAVQADRVAVVAVDVDAAGVADVDIALEAVTGDAGRIAVVRGHVEGGVVDDGHVADGADGGNPQRVAGIGIGGDRAAVVDRGAAVARRDDAGGGTGL